MSSLRASRLSLLSCRSISWLIRFCSLASSDMQHVMFLSVRVAQPPASIIWGEPWPSLQSPWLSLDGDVTPWRLALACTRHSYEPTEENIIATEERGSHLPYCTLPKHITHTLARTNRVRAPVELRASLTSTGCGNLQTQPTQIF